MQFSTILSAIVAVSSATLVLAAPAADPATSLATRSPLEKRNEVKAILYSNGGCGGNAQIITKNAPGNFCFQNQGGNAIDIQWGEPFRCTFRTWSGGNCRGSSQTISSEECVNIAFASVEISCLF